LPEALTWPDSAPEYSQQSHTASPLEQTESVPLHLKPTHFAESPVSAAHASVAAASVHGLLDE
jgi:hypothetical protein